MTRAEKKKLIDFYEETVDAIYSTEEGHPTRTFYTNKLVAAAQIARLLGVTDPELERAYRRARRRAGP